MTKKKLAPPTWDEKNNRWKKTAYCNGMSKTFYSKKRGATSAEREIAAAINDWKSKMERLSGNKGLTPMSRVKDVYLEYIADLQSRTSQSNWRPATARFNRWILPLIGNLSILDLNDGVIQRVVNNAYVKGKLSKKSIKNIRGDLSAFAKFCRKNQLTAYRVEDVDIPRSAAKTSKKILQPDDLKILFSVDTTMRYNQRVFEPYIYAFRLQVLHNLRPGEVAGLKKSDRVGDIVHLQRSINVDGEETTGKNENAVRPFMLSELGKECWDKQAALSSSEWLFPGYTEKIYYHHLKRYCHFNGITSVSPYELRHTSVSVSNCLPAGLVKAAAGHSKNMDTFGVYGHEVQGDLALTADLIQERFDDLLGNDKKQGQNHVK